MVRYCPKGQVDLTLTLPVTNPTSIAIGGPNMDWLIIITSAKHSLSAEQLSNESQAGDVHIYQLVGINGLQSHLAEISKIFT